MGSCLCKSTENLAKVFISYPMNDLSSVYKSKNIKTKPIKNEKYKVKEISNNGGSGQN